MKETAQGARTAGISFGAAAVGTADDQERHTSGTSSERPPRRGEREQHEGRHEPEHPGSDIERTREDLAETMDAIGDQISPKLQARRQMDRLRQSGADRSARRWSAEPSWSCSC